MKKILVLATLLTIVGVSYGRTPTSGNMWNVSDYSGTYGWEINTDGSFVPMTSSCVLGNATYPIATATITTAGITTGNITTANVTNLALSANPSHTVSGTTVYQIVVATTVADNFDYAVTTVNGKVGWGNISISSGTYGAQFTFTDGGQVNLSVSTGTTTTNDNDGTLNVYDTASGIVLENQAGSRQAIVGVLYYIN